MGNCFKKIPDKIDIKTDIENDVDTTSRCCNFSHDDCPSSCCIFYIVRSKSKLDLKPT